MTKEDRRRMMDYIERIKKATSDAELWLMYKGYTREDDDEEHAHWIPDESETGEGSNTYKCSACGEIQMLIEGTPKENGWKYCPNCGAMMLRGEQDG